MTISLTYYTVVNITFYILYYILNVNAVRWLESRIIKTGQEIVFVSPIKEMDRGKHLQTVVILKWLNNSWFFCCLFWMKYKMLALRNCEKVDRPSVLFSAEIVAGKAYELYCSLMCAFFSLQILKMSDLWPHRQSPLSMSP